MTSDAIGLASPLAISWGGGAMTRRRHSVPRPGADEWRFRPNSELDWIQRLLVARVAFLPQRDVYTIPKPQGKAPVMLEWHQLLVCLPFMILPALFRYLFMTLTGWTIPAPLLYLLHVVHSSVFLRSFQQRMRKTIMTYGYLDASSERDTVPESATTKLFYEILTGSVIRPLLVFLLSYDRDVPPQFSLWTPLQLGVFTIIADFLYYWVHRSTHETEWLWSFHKKHHTTKHPNPFLLAYADEIQEVFDALASPIFAYVVYPLPFDTLYLWSLAFVATEITGHAGVRVYFTGILTSFWLRPFHCDIIVEDHDIHHRYGWRKSFNYGKQSLLWDKIFGTDGERLELQPHHVDWHRPAW